MLISNIDYEKALGKWEEIKESQIGDDKVQKLFEDVEYFFENDFSKVSDKIFNYISRIDSLYDFNNFSDILNKISLEVGDYWDSIINLSLIDEKLSDKEKEKIKKFMEYYEINREDFNNDKEFTDKFYSWIDTANEDIVNTKKDIYRYFGALDEYTNLSGYIGLSDAIDYKFYDSDLLNYLRDLEDYDIDDDNIKDFKERIEELKKQLLEDIDIVDNLSDKIDNWVDDIWFDVEEDE